MITLRELSIDDYDEIISLWKRLPGIGLSSADGRPAIEAFLSRNPGMSYVATDGERRIGTILAGHDGRRGYLHHLAVADDYRKQGIGRLLTERAVTSLGEQGIEKCHIFVFRRNRIVSRFWKKLGFELRKDITLRSRQIG